VHEDHFCGLYRGVCSDNRDPEGLFRIRVKIPQVYGNITLPYWAWPCLPPGWRNALVKPHADHTFTDVNDGEFSSGSVARTLPHTNNHTLVKPVPDLGQGVWIQFEGGDPERPVWLGTF
jgi:hypothetical protein